MEEFEIDDFTIPAKSEDEAMQKADALYILAEVLNGDDLEGMANVIKEKPEIVATIKKWLINPPPLIKGAMKLAGFND
ncbi:MAG: hypothetical protein MUC49_14770 [Raineya sp.]|jgi:hypothetical protein|nr:hypothetical protein [Raineya sp.]